jgi:hypothetical protein
VVWLEPGYPNLRDKEGNVHALDYEKLPIPVTKIQKIDKEFDTFVGGKKIAFEVSTGISRLGKPTYFIKDLEGY